MDGFVVDNSELDKLAADLGEVSEDAGRNIPKAVEVTARKIKDDWRDEAKGMAHAPAFPFSVTYDIGSRVDQSFVQAASSVISGAFTGGRSTTVVAEIGPDKGRPQGALGNLIEFGSVNNPPQGLGHGALQRNEADFEKGLSLATRDAERANGL